MPTEERVFAYEFNGYDRLKKVTDPMGNTLELEYDEAGNVTKRSWNGDLTDDSTDGLSNVLLREISYVWDERERMTDEAHSFFKYDGSMTPTVATFNKEYNGVNQVSATIDAESNRVDILRDTAHRIEQVEFPLFNRTEILQIDANGNSLESRDTDTSSLPSTPSAHYATTNNLYDELDRLDQSTDNAGNITKYGYDSRGNLIQAIDANMVERRYLYDGLNRLIVSVIDMDGDGALISVDSMTCDLVVDPDDIVTTQVWDDSSRLIAQIDDSGNDTRYAFDEHNRQIVRRMADGTLHQIGFGATWASGSSVPDLSNFQTGYDLQGNLVQSLDANGTTLMCTYDKNNRLTSREAFPVSSDIKGVTLETYSYDGLGRVIKAENDDCIVNRTYDSMGNLIVEEIDIDKTAMISGPETKRTYDKVGNATTLEYPSGRIINTSYDEFNRKKTITDGSDSETFHYLGRNTLEARILGTGTIGSYSGFDYSLGAVRTPKTIGHQVVGGAFLSLNSLTWDGVGNKLTKQGSLTGAIKHEYEYDDAYRLVDTTVSEVSSSNELRHTEYDLDGVHNRSSVTEALLAGTPDVMAYTLIAGAPDYDLELNQYSVTPMDARVYDANGNWIEKRDPAAPTNLIATIYYDAFNRMVEYQEFGGPKHTYKYDCFGRRVAKVIDDGGVAEEETRFYYGERDNWHVIEERDGQGAPTATYVFGNGVDEIISMERDVVGDSSPETYYYLLDEQNTVEALVEIVASVATIQERYEYGDYGEPTIFDSGGSLVMETGFRNSAMYSGRRYDDETGLYLYRTRYLDASSGKFSTRDTIGAWGDAGNFGNAVAYSSCNPTSLIDPYGSDGFAASLSGSAVVGPGSVSSTLAAAGAGISSAASATAAALGEVAAGISGSAVLVVGGVGVVALGVGAMAVGTLEALERAEREGPPPSNWEGRLGPGSESCTAGPNPFAPPVAPRDWGQLLPPIVLAGTRGPSGRNEPHGSQEKADKILRQCKEVENQIEQATGRAKKFLKNKLKTIKENAGRAKRGETHHN